MKPQRKGLLKWILGGARIQVFQLIFICINMSSQQQTDKTPHRGQHFKKAYGGF